MSVSSRQHCNPVKLFREAAPYIQAHKNKTIVIALSSELIASEHLKNTLRDIATLATLGLKIILVHGVRWYIDQHPDTSKQKINGVRVTDHISNNLIRGIVGEQRLFIESQLSFILNTPGVMSAETSVISGNFIIAKPIGVRDGVDFLYTGLVRKLQNARIQQQLDAHNIVLLSPNGLSPTGVSYNLSYKDVAIHTAKAMQADKLVFIANEFSALPKEMSLKQALQLQTDYPVFVDIEAAIQAGVSRVHLLDGELDGGLLLELFTREGVGTLISDDRFEHIEQANLSDIGSIIELIRPLEKQGVLIKRSREQLELEISNFYVLKRDRKVIACAALYPIAESDAVEMACFVVDSSYRGQDKGDLLLKHLVKTATNAAFKTMLVLTTQTTDWFQERGFVIKPVTALPPKRQALYNFQRNSHVLMRSL